MEHPPMEHPPHDARRSKRRLGKAALVLAVLAGCMAALSGLVMTFSNTESPVDGPLLPPLMLVLVAAPVCVAAILVHRILRGGGSRDDDGFLP
jgi:peptidoglycan/LPS O-acetylase OafA/YrhL